MGGTGTGKTHLATAIGVAAIHCGKRVLFYNAVDLVNQLEREKSLGKVGNLAKQLCLMDAVIIDELGYLPFPASSGATPLTSLFCGFLIQYFQIRHFLGLFSSPLIAKQKPISIQTKTRFLHRPHYPRQ